MFIYNGPDPDPNIAIGRFYNHHGPIGCDVETVSLDDRTPLGAAFAINPSESFYFQIDSPLFPWGLLRNPGQEVIFHNAGFDVQVLEDWSGDQVTSIGDSCLLAMILGLPGRLSQIVEMLYGREPRLITDLIGEGKDQITMADVPVEKVAERGCLDAQEALEVWMYLHREYTVPVKALDLETRFLPVALQMQKTGIKIDTKRVHEHRLELDRRLTFYRMVAEGIGFNPGSSQQLAIALEGRGYRVLYRTGKDGKRRPRLNKEILRNYYAVEPIAQLTLQYRSTQTLLTHLIRPLDEGRYLVGDRIYPRVNLNVTDTGRISRSNPATQNINGVLRDIVIPSEGNMIHDWDFSQIELRCAAYMWEDNAMQEIFKRGEDVHQATADQLVAAGMGNILGDTNERRRRLAKDLNFAMLFGGDEQTLWERRRIPLDMGKKLVEGYFTKFRGIANGIEKTKKEALANGFTETMYGRKRIESEKLESGKEYLIADALRKLINHPIQGSAAEILKEAMWVTKNEPQFHTVHDEVLSDVEPGYVYPGKLHRVAPFDTPITEKIGPNYKDLVDV